MSSTFQIPHVGYRVEKGKDLRELNDKLAAALQEIVSLNLCVIAVLPDPMPHKQTEYMATIFFRGKSE